MSTEPEYRLVADENEPITLDQVVAMSREPRQFEVDPLAANMSSAIQAADAALAGGEQRDSREDTERIQDLLTNLFHLADLLGLDMDDLVNSAQRNYEAEIRGVL